MIVNMFKQESRISEDSARKVAIPQHQLERKKVVCQYLVLTSLVLYAISDDRHYRISGYCSHQIHEG